MKILIVDDDKDCRTIVNHHLSKMGECTFAENGAEAVAAYGESLNTPERVSLICLDIMMPAVDGLDALRQIRALESEHGIGGMDRVKVIMTSALGDSKHVLGAFRDGCEAYLVKPFTREKLLAKIKELGIPVPE